MYRERDCTERNDRSSLNRTGLLAKHREQGGSLFAARSTRRIPMIVLFIVLARNKLRKTQSLWYVPSADPSQVRSLGLHTGNNKVLLCPGVEVIKCGSRIQMFCSVMKFPTSTRPG